MNKDITVLILTYRDQSGKVVAPHIQWLKASNPDVDIKLIVRDDLSDLRTDLPYAWRNGDELLRFWWKQNKDKITTPVVVVLEYDVLVTVKLPSLPPGIDLAGARVVTPTTYSNWYWFHQTNEITKLDKLKIQDKHLTGIVPFGGLIMKREVLDSISKTKWDKAYTLDIFCELRFPTIAIIEKYKIGEIYLPNVGWAPKYRYSSKEINNFGIYHPVKETFTKNYEKISTNS